MPVIQSDGCPLNVDVAGPEDKAVLMFCNSLGTDLHMWDPQLQPLAKHFRLIRYDRRGHGKSGVPKGPYTMEMLGRDALAIMNGLGVQKVNWCGLSMGGMVGQWLGANAPDRIERLVLANTNYYYPVKDFWHDRIKTVADKGLAAIVAPNMERWFTEGFRKREPGIIATMTDMFVKTPVEGYLACCAAIRDMDHRELLAKIKAPTLIIAGRSDLATPVEAAMQIQKQIPGAALTVLEAAHISNVEQPIAFSYELLGFLTERKA